MIAHKSGQAFFNRAQSGGYGAFGIPRGRAIGTLFIGNAKKENAGDAQIRDPAAFFPRSDPVTTGRCRGMDAIGWVTPVPGQTKKRHHQIG